MHVVLIDDDGVGAAALRQALGAEDDAYTVSVFGNGQEARVALGGEFGRGLVGTPHVILVNAALPDMSGYALLEWLGEQPKLCATPVFVLASSNSPQEISRAYEWPIAGCIVKANAGPELRGLRPLLAAYARVNLVPPPERRWE